MVDRRRDKAIMQSVHQSISSRHPPANPCLHANKGEAALGNVVIPVSESGRTIRSLPRGALKGAVTDSLQRLEVGKAEGNCEVTGLGDTSAEFCCCSGKWKKT
ncbi:hypothetical protein L596_025495 [Steinernema carpocapsae]|uniref:Uncharacterized protein n=1 Tax=Steinernema carpocapsae TaxID=34508 RepID=A0A4U5M7X0_STECR|nr:hypothetical protein L596_025495 [Steinernema carpocapsae]